MLYGQIHTRVMAMRLGWQHRPLLPANQAEKDDPQPQVVVALGLRITN